QHEAFGIHEQMALTSFDLLAAVTAAWAADAAGFHRLAVNAARTRLLIASQPLAEPLPQEPMDPLPRPIASPATQIGIHGLPGRPLLGKKARGAAGPQLIEAGVADGARGVQTRTADGRFGRHERLQQRPFGVGEISGREQRRGVHPPAYLT